MKRLPLTIVTFLLLTASASAQQWTLRQCIDHALEHNISIKQRGNQNEQRAIEVNTVTNSRLPSLSMSAGENLSFGRGLTSDNTYANRSTTSTMFGLSTSVPLFTGTRQPNQLKLAKINLEAATADLEKAKNDLSMQVAQYYISAVYDKEIVSVAERQITIDSMQVHRLQELVNYGKATKAELSQQESTLANSKVTLVQAQNDLELALLNLSQLLELPSAERFDIVTPNISSIVSNSSVPNAEAIFEEAVTIRPEITAEQLRLKGTEYSINMAKSALYPTLDLSGSIGSNYYHTSGMPGTSFSRQMRDNFNQGIGVNLYVPIFNRMATRNSIRSAKIDQANQRLALDNARKQLYKEIQQVCLNVKAAESKYTSSETAAKSSENAFELAKAKYEAGKATITEFNEMKNNLLKAQSDLVRAKFELIYQSALLNFYSGKPLSM